MNRQPWSRVHAALFLILLWAPRDVFAEEKWVKIESTYFTLYSAANLSQTRKLAEEFELFVYAMSHRLQLAPARLPPALIVIFEDNEALTPFKPNRGEQAMDADVVAISSSLRTTITLCLHDSSKTLHRSIFFGGASWFLSGFDEPGPDWLRYGLAEVFSSFEASGNEITLGKGIRPYVDRLATRGNIMPMFRLMGERADVVHATNLEQSINYHAQCWAFVHYLCFGKGGRGLSSVGEYLRLLQTQDPEKAFPQAFGVSPETMETKLREYMFGGRYMLSVSTLNRAEIVSELRSSSATPMEVLLAKAYLKMMIREQDAARVFIEQARAVAPGAPEIEEAMGDLAALANETEQATYHYRAAVAAGSKNYRIYDDLACRLMQEALGPDRPSRTTGPGAVPWRSRAVISAPVARRAANYFERAINLNPYSVRSYENLAVTLGYVGRPTAEDPKFLELGLKLAPNNPMLLVGQAELALRAGRREEARQRLTRIDQDPEPMSARAVTYLVSVQQELEIADTCAQLDQLIAERKVDAASAQLGHLREQQPAAALQTALDRRQRTLGELHLCDMVNACIAQAQWAEAERLIAPLAASASTPEIQKLAVETLATIRQHTQGVAPAGGK